jgi:hypothetical protein
MLHAQVFKFLISGLNAPGLHVFIALPDTFNSFLIIGAFRFEIRGQSYQIHAPRVEAYAARVNP